MRRAVLVIALISCAGLAGYFLLESGRVRVPERWNPWAPLNLADEPNLLTGFKLRRLADDRAACLDVLRQTPFRFRSVPDREIGPGCAFHNAVVVSATDFQLDRPLTLSCPLAAAVALWERHSVEPAAERILGTKVTRLEHFGSYSCRNVYGRTDAPKSRHATADALDVAGFVLADGRRIRVVNDWNRDSAAAAFLHDAHDGACKFFSSVLSPDYNTAHRDHFHLDRGTFGLCR